MRYQVKRIGNKFSVENEVTGYKYSKGTTKSKALGQLHLLNAVEHGFKQLHNYHSKIVPRGRRKNSMEK